MFLLNAKNFLKQMLVMSSSAFVISAWIQFSFFMPFSTREERKNQPANIQNTKAEWMFSVSCTVDENLWARKYEWERKIAKKPFAWRANAAIFMIHCDSGLFYPLPAPPWKSSKIFHEIFTIYRAKILLTDKRTNTSAETSNWQMSTNDNNLHLFSNNKSCANNSNWIARMCWWDTVTGWVALNEWMCLWVRVLRQKLLKTRVKY